MAIDRLIDGVNGAADERDLSLPPHSIQAEEAVLGSVMKNPASLVRVSDFLRPEDFYQPRHRHIFHAMLALTENGQPIDYHTVADELQRQGTYEASGGLLYLSELNLATPTSAHIEHYARIVERTSIDRRVIGAASTIAEMAYADRFEPETLLEKAERLIMDINDGRRSRDFRPLDEVLSAVMDQVEASQDGNAAKYGIPTGYIDLDQLLAGFQRTDLIILAARTSVGKTSFAMNLALNAAIKARATVAIFSLEMSAEQLASRLLSMESGVDSSRVRQGELNEHESRKLGHAMNYLAEAPIWVDDTPSIPIMELRSKARRLAAEHGLDMIVVDYLQLITGDKGESRVQEIGNISRALKALARELRVPIIALSQLSRAVEQRTPHIPQLSDLRESGCLAGETLIALADGSCVPIASLVGSQPQVVTLDGWHVSTATASKVWRTGHKPVFRLETRTGRSIRATANHPFRVLHGWKALDRLVVGDRLALPRVYPEPHAARAWDEDRIVLLGHLIGDGCYASRQPLHYTSASETNLAVVERAALHAFGVQGRRVQQQSWQHLYLSAGADKCHPNPISAWLRELGINGQRSGEKVIPTAVLTLPHDQVGLFLKHLWATDGCNLLHKATHGLAGAIYYASKSRRLAEQVQYLLNRLGIRSRIKAVGKQGYADTYHVSVNGKRDQLLFAQHVGAHGERVPQLQAIVHHLEQRSANTNLDTIPREVWQDVSTLMRQQGVTQRQMAAVRGTSYGGSSHFRFAPSREAVAGYATILQAPQLGQLATAEVVWDEVVAIQPDGEEDVFDMTVPGSHNFVANGLVVHNSIEQDADVVLFIYREDKYNPDSEKKGIAEIIVAKHRNGPTGSVNLLFLERTTKFHDLEVHRS